MTETTKIEPVEETSEPEDCSDLVVASESSLDFWNNPIDDETWNEA